MNNPTKQMARSAIQAIVNRLPWGIRNSVLEACMKRFGQEDLMTRLLPEAGIAEVGVMGDLGLIRSAWNDRQILTTYARTGTAEDGIVRTFVEYFGDGSGTYIDVGANIGLTTIPIARNPLVQCIAFEPEPVNFRSLRINVLENVAGNTVEMHQSAVFDRRTTLSLAIADGNLGDHRVTMGGIAGRATVQVTAVPLDDMLDRVTDKLAVKIDTQGAEPAVISGGRQILARAGLVAMEFCPFLIRQQGGDPNVVIEFASGFDSLALLEPGSEKKPVFENVSFVLERLRSKAQTAQDSDGDYLDIVGRRLTPNA